MKPTKTIALTRAEAATIAQLALLERIEGSLGIWSHLKQRMRPKSIRVAARRRKRIGFCRDLLVIAAGRLSRTTPGQRSKDG
jgi:hypothetical protein